MAYSRYGFNQKSSYKRDGTDLYTEETVDIGTLDTYNDDAVTSAINKINTLNPNHKYLMFAMLSDIHKGHNFSYAGIDARSEQTFQMMAKVNESCNFDGIVCGGDLINGYDEVQYYQDNLEWVASMFNKYFPNTAICTTVGNHDKKYDDTVPLRTNEYLSTQYKRFISSSKDVIVRELQKYPTNYAMDFLKCKVRLIFINGYDGYDKISSPVTTGRWKKFMNIENANEWMIGTVSHTPYESDTSISLFLNKESEADYTNTNGVKGKGYIGSFRGHTHSYKKDNDNQITVGCAYETQSYVGTRVSGEFVVFIVDTDNEVVHSVIVGRGATSDIDTISIQYS